MASSPSAVATSASNQAMPLTAGSLVSPHFQMTSTLKPAAMLSPASGS